MKGPLGARARTLGLRLERHPPTEPGFKARYELWDGQSRVFLAEHILSITAFLDGMDFERRRHENET